MGMSVYWPLSVLCMFVCLYLGIGSRVSITCDRKEALGMRLMSTKTMVRCYVMGNVYMCSKAFYTSKVELGYIGNSAISLQKKIDINLQVWLCSNLFDFGSHYQISVSLTRPQFPVLHFCLLYQTSLPYIKFLDCCHRAHKLGQRHILPSVVLVKQQACVVSQ